MSNPCLIGVARPGGTYSARWLSWGDAPHHLIPVLRSIRDFACARATEVLVGELLAHDWASLTPSALHGRRDAMIPVSGIGYAVPDHGVRHHGGRVTEHVDPDLDWLYLIDIDTDTVVVYEATRHSQWLWHSRHPFDLDATDPVLGCGGYVTNGHQWRPTLLRVPGDDTDFSAEVCTGTHLGNATAVRITEATADAIARHLDDTQGSTAPAPYPRRAGAEFDLVWSVSEHPWQPTRIPRDSDGWLLLTGPLWLWHLTGSHAIHNRPPRR